MKRRSFDVFNEKKGSILRTKSPLRHTTSNHFKKYKKQTRKIRWHVPSEIYWTFRTALNSFSFFLLLFQKKKLIYTLHVTSALLNRGMAEEIQFFEVRMFGLCKDRNLITDKDGIEFDCHFWEDTQN